LPGAAQLDEALLDEAVRDLNGIQLKKKLELVVAVGNYVLRVFFAGQFEAFRQRRKKHVTFRQLGRHVDLRMSATVLYNAVAVTEQLDQLPEELGKALGFSKHKALLPVTDLQCKLELAQLAVEEGLTVRRLRHVVSQVDEVLKRRRGGRPTLPDGVKEVRRLRTASAAVGDVRISARKLFAHEEVDDMRTLADELEARARDLRAATDRHVDREDGGGQLVVT